MDLAKYVLPVVAGAMTGMILIKLGEICVGKMYAGSNELPDSAFAALIVNYMTGSFLAGVVASLVAKRETARPAIVIGIVLTLAGFYNMMHLTHPLWFAITNLFVFLPFVYAGYLTVKKKVVV
jgi:hypothetical protein